MHDKHKFYKNKNLVGNTNYTNTTHCGHKTHMCFVLEPKSTQENLLNLRSRDFLVATAQLKHNLLHMCLCTHVCEPHFSCVLCLNEILLIFEYTIFGKLWSKLSKFKPKNR